MHGVRLVLVCGACPEAYTAFIGEEQVGYLRLRHGVFTADCPDYGGERVFCAYPKGDGIFDVNERRKYLSEACIAILQNVSMRKTGENYT